MSRVGRDRLSVRLACALFRRLIALMPPEFNAGQRAGAIDLMERLIAESRGIAGPIVVAASVFADLFKHMVAQRLHRRAAFTRGHTSMSERLLLIADALMRDIRDAARSLVHRPVQSVAIIATIAVGIGLNAAVFSVVDWVLLRPLPYPSPEELVRVWVADNENASAPGAVTYSEIQHLSAARSLRAAVGLSAATRIARGDGLDPMHVVVARVTGDLFGVIGAHPLIGRPFDAKEIASGQPVAVLSQSLWRNRFASDPTIAGRIVTIDNRPYTIVGVMPPRMAYPHDADVWRPATAEEREDDDRENVMIARLNLVPGSANVTAELNALLPGSNESGSKARLVMSEGLQRAQVRDVRAALALIFAASSLVLIIACTNVAALLGTRTAERSGELAVRAALGARGGQLARQLLVECVLIAVLGGAAGVVLGSIALDLVVALAPAGTPRLDEIALDARVVIFGAAATLLVGAAICVLPSRLGSKVDLRSTLAAASSSRLSRASGIGRVLVAMQLVLAVVLTLGAGLLTRSLQNLLAVDHGFNPARLTAITPSASLRSVQPREALNVFRGLVEAARGVPGVESAAMTFRLPTETGGLRTSIRVEGQPAERATPAWLRIVSPGYFETIGLRLIEGRQLADSDTQTTARVAVVNTAFVRSALGGEAAANRRLTTDAAEQPITIVGVVADVTPAGEHDRPAVYVPYEQLAINAGSLILRTTGPASGVLPVLRPRLSAAAPTIALDRIQSIEALLATTRSVTRFNTTLVSSFGVLALMLAMIGVYGLAAMEVMQRRRDCSVRSALGATRREILWSVMRPIGWTMFVALVAGVIAGVGAAAAMRSLLSGVSPIDPVTLLALPVLIAAIGACAALLAARPILREDPAVRLRT